MKSLFLVFILLGILFSQISAFSILRSDVQAPSIPVSKQANLPECPAGSATQSVVIDAFNQALEQSTLTVPIASTATSVVACFVVDSPLAGYSAWFNFSYPGVDSSFVFNYTFSFNGAVSEQLSGNVEQGTFQAGPFFFSPPVSQYLSSGSNEAVIIISLDIEPTNLAPFEIDFVVLTADASWSEVNNTVIDYPVFAGMLLSAPIPLANNTRTFTYTLAFDPELSSAVTLEPCYIASAACAGGAQCVPVSAPVALAAKTTQYTITYTLPSTIADKCQVEGVAIQLIPAAAAAADDFFASAYLTDFGITPRYSSGVTSPSKGGLSDGAIIGIAVGVGVGIILLVLLGVFLYRRSKRTDYQEF